MKSPIRSLLLFSSLFANESLPLRAQVVPDGATVTLSDITNAITGNVTVGTNGSFTLLVLSDNTLLTNSANGIIGAAASARSNQVQLVSATARWQMGTSLFVGSNGASSQLVISNGALVENNGSVLGYVAGSTNNLALVTGSGSLWTNRGNVSVGSETAGNRLIVTNSGRVASRLGYVGLQKNSSNNLVTVSGIGSAWTNQMDLEFGYKGINNRMVIDAGGVVICDNGRIGSGGELFFGGAVPTGNEMLIAGPGSLWTNRSSVAVVDNLVGGFCGLTVSNGAAVVSGGTGLVGGTANQLLVTGAGSRWANESDFTLGGTANRLELMEGAWLACSNATIGSFFSGADDFVLVSGAGSAWTNRGDLTMGLSSGVRSTVIASNGASFICGGSALMGMNVGADFNTLYATDPGTSWQIGSELYVGSNGALNRLIISNGSFLVSSNAFVGAGSSGNNNSAVVTGAGSVWSNQTFLYLGDRGSGNRLVVTDGGLATPQGCFIGQTAGSSNNQAIIGGNGSRLTLRNGTLFVGRSHNTGNQLIVTNGAAVLSPFAYIGFQSSNNLAVVGGPGSTWTNTSQMFMGQEGTANRLIITNGGLVFSQAGIFMSLFASASNNLVLVDGGTLTVPLDMDSFPARYEIQRGSNVLNAGLIDVNLLILTNSRGFFTFNGGTLITHGAVISNGLPFVVGGSSTTPALWDVRAGVSNTVISGDLYIGSNAPFAQLILTNGAWLTNSGASAYGILGRQAGAHSNSVTVAGPGSGWFLEDGVFVGDAGSGNRLVASNGATLVTASSSIIGNELSSTNNEVVITGTGTSWTSGAGQLFVGNGGRNNRLVVSDGATVVSSSGTIGDAFANSSNNLALVTGAGASWSNTSELRVGDVGAGNQLVVSNGGAVFAGSAAYVGFTSSSIGNRLVVDGGTLRVTNVSATGVLDVRRGTNILSSGLVEVDRLLVTNTPGRMVLNGGTLSVRSATINNGVSFHVGNNIGPATLFLAGNDTHLFNTGLLIDDTATLSGNGTIGGGTAVLTGGTLSPGASIGKLVFTSTLVLGGTVFMEISKSGAALTNDQVQTTSTLAYGSALVVTNLGPTALAAGDKFKLFDCPGFTGSFTSIALPPLTPGLFWTNKLLLDGSIEVSAPPERFWTNALGGAYNVASNWFAHIIPTPQENAVFTNSASYEVTWPADATAANAFFRSVGGTVTQSIGSASWTLTNSYVVDSGNLSFQAFVRHPSGVLRVTNATGTARLVLGGTGFGSYTLNGGEIIADQFLATNGNLGQFGFLSGILRTRHIAVNPSSGLFVGNTSSPATLDLLGNGIHLVGNFFTISSNATLIGNGTIAGELQVEGNLSPGASIGQLTVQRALVFGLGSSNFFEINKAAATNDNIIGATNVIYHGKLVVTNLAGTLAAGDKFRLFSASAYAHTGFESLVLPPLAPGLKWENNLILDGSLQVVTNPVRDFGIDVSHWQNESGVPQANWNQLFAEGRRFVFIKATEGLTGPHDPTMAVNVSRAMTAGLFAGVYHHCHPENRPTTDGAISEATNFVAYAGSAIGPGRLRPVITVEFAAGNLSTPALTDWVIAFSDTVIALRGSNAAPIIYCDQIFANFEFDSRLATYDLWLRTVGTAADPAIDDPPSQLGMFPTGVFNDWAFWQYSGSGSAGGLSPLDLDVCHSEHKPLASFLIPGAPPTPIHLTMAGLTGGGAFQIHFTNTPTALFTMLATTNPSLPLSNWTVLGSVTESPSGQFTFTDLQATNNPQRFYRVRSP